MRIIASFIRRVHRNDSSNGRQHAVFVRNSLRRDAHDVQVETLRQHPSRCLIELLSIFDMIILQDEFPYVHLMVFGCFGHGWIFGLWLKGHQTADERNQTGRWVDISPQTMLHQTLQRHSEMLSNECCDFRLCWSWQGFGASWCRSKLWGRWWILQENRLHERPNSKG